MKTVILSQLVSLLAGGAIAASTFEPARPPSIPLAVRNPYLHTWLEVGSDGGSGGYLAGYWPNFWPGQTTGWAGLIRVDGTTYTWMGDPGPASVDQTSFEYTATRSMFMMNVGTAVELNVTFASPIYPNDLKRQSLAFSYLDVTVNSLDGAEHDVQLYADISAEWISGDRTAIAQWDYGTTGSNSSSSKRDSTVRRAGDRRSVAVSGNSTTTAPNPTGTSTGPHPTSTYPSGGIAYHRVYRQTQLAFSEIADQTEYGYWYWATDNVANLTYQSGADSDVRSTFQNNGFLEDTQDTNYRAIEDDYPVFGFAVDLGSVGSDSVNTLFSLGLAQEEVIQFDGASGNVTLPGLWTSYFSDDLDSLSFFHNDYAHASGTCSNFDSQLISDANAAAGSDYYAITALSARQAFGATQLAGDTNNTYMFLKEISSDGNINTVDVIFPMHPILLYSNPNLLNLLLKPLYENQESGQYPNTYSMHDLGSHYPNATGHPAGDDEQQPLEECGNMLIMTLAYYQRSNDLAYLNQHYKILQQWVGYLIQEALIPANQISTDDFAGALANQTNLALKGIIGIGAMAQIANLTGHISDAQNYSTTAQSYINQWQTLAISNSSVNGSTSMLPHTTLNYGNESSYSLLYNLYGDALLKTNLVPQYVYDMQSNFYPTVFNTYGVPLDTRHTETKADWQMFCASIASTSTRDLFHSTLLKWINTTPTNRGLTDLYDTFTGDYPDDIFFLARPVMGGSFGLLALGNVTGFS